MTHDWLDSDRIQSSLESLFGRIHHQRMAGLPIVNGRLQVKTLPFRRYNGEWTGILITPWCMNLLVLPETSSAWPDAAAGDKISRSYPYGEFLFTVARDIDFGYYASCSLYSPMFQFQQQPDAETAAEVALNALFADPAPTPAASHDPAAKPLSRRELLLGRKRANPS